MKLFRKAYKPVFITTKSAFTITLIVIALTIIIVWLQGLHLERSILRNSFLSTAILSSFLFLFMSIGLYRGYKLKDNVGKITDTFKPNSDSSDDSWVPESSIALDIDMGDGIEGAILSIVIWILATFVIGILLVFFGNFIWFSVLLLLAILYWIFFRGLRLVFKKSPICQGDFLLSIKYAFVYTCLSTLWLVVVLFVLEHQNYSLVALGALFQ
jgi:hypothetical protein